jgi:multisubunit Na+/H+ antiporter MnhB subunit
MHEKAAPPAKREAMAMPWETILKAMRRILQLVAAGLGGMGIMALWGSFYWPECGLDAVVMLSTATIIVLALSDPQGTARPPQSGPGRKAGFVQKLRRVIETANLRRS